MLYSLLLWTPVALVRIDACQFQTPLHGEQRLCRRGLSRFNQRQLFRRYLVLSPHYLVSPTVIVNEVTIVSLHDLNVLVRQATEDDLFHLYAQRPSSAAGHGFLWQVRWSALLGCVLGTNRDAFELHSVLEILSETRLLLRRVANCRVVPPLKRVVGNADAWATLNAWLNVDGNDLTALAILGGEATGPLNLKARTAPHALFIDPSEHVFHATQR